MIGTSFLIHEAGKHTARDGQGCGALASVMPVEKGAPGGGFEQEVGKVDMSGSG